MAEQLFAGVGRADITPDLGVRLGGYALEERPVESINDRLNSTTLVFKQGDLKTVLINLDWLGAMEDQVQDIRQRITDKTGIAGNHIVITTIHSHTAPNTIDIPGWGKPETTYLEQAIPKIVKSAVEANNNLKQVKIGVATTESQTGVNRRAITQANTCSFNGDPSAIYDPTMTVIRLETAEAPLATVIHYGAHATAFGQGRVVSRDWPGIMVDRVESQTGVPALFINGPIGDIGPRTNQLCQDQCSLNAGAGDGLDAIREVGYRAATDALAAYIDIKTWHENATLGVISEVINFNYAPLPSLELAQQKLEEFKEHKGGFGSDAFEYNRWQMVIDAHQGEPATAKQYEQTILQLGPVAIVPFPGELFSGISLRLRQWSPFQYTLCTSVSNGYFAYIPTREALHREGYEVWMAKSYNGYGFADNIDDLMVEQNLSLLQKL